MFLVDNTLVSDDLLDAQFCCNLAACKGACCVVGDTGAPLEDHEREVLERALPAVDKYLRPEARAVIQERGVWEKSKSNGYVTTCVDDAECVFVTYERGVAKCSFQKAYNAGELDFPKPISCHLYPVRVERSGDRDMLNYETISLCDPARKYGRRKNIPLANFLREPLVRKYGEEWFERFQSACAERSEALSPTP